MVFERFVLPIVLKEYLLIYTEAKASEGDSPRMSENIIFCHNGNEDASFFDLKIEIRGGVKQSNYSTYAGVIRYVSYLRL